MSINGRRFAHVIHDDGTDHWQQLRADEVRTDELEATYGDIRCLVWTPNDPFVPDHCPDCEQRSIPA